MSWGTVSYNPGWLWTQYSAKAGSLEPDPTGATFPVLGSQACASTHISTSRNQYGNNRHAKKERDVCVGEMSMKNTCLYIQCEMPGWHLLVQGVAGIK